MVMKGVGGRRGQMRRIEGARTCEAKLLMSINGNAFLKPKAKNKKRKIPSLNKKLFKAICKIE